MNSENTRVNAPAASLSWSPELVLGDERTDATHQEFIDLLNATANASEQQKILLYQSLVAHTVEHFGQEERWMRANGISDEHCHFSQHSSVLEVMKEVERRALTGETALIGQMLEALVEWFPMHAQSMDAALVEFLRDKGFDTSLESLSAAPASGVVSI